MLAYYKNAMLSVLAATGAILTNICNKAKATLIREDFLFNLFAHAICRYCENHEHKNS